MRVCGACVASSETIYFLQRRNVMGGRRAHAVGGEYMGRAHKFDCGLLHSFRFRLLSAFE